MFIHDRRGDFGWKISQLEQGLPVTSLQADIGPLDADIDTNGNFVGRRNWGIKEKAIRGTQRFGITLRDSWLPFMGGTGGASLSVWGLREAFDMLTPGIPWIIPGIAGGLVGWKAGEWCNQGTTKLIELVNKPIQAFRSRYYFRWDL